MFHPYLGNLLKLLKEIEQHLEFSLCEYPQDSLSAWGFCRSVCTVQQCRVWKLRDFIWLPNPREVRWGQAQWPREKLGRIPCGCSLTENRQITQVQSWKHLILQEKA